MPARISAKLPMMFDSPAEKPTKEKLIFVRGGHGQEFLTFNLKRLRKINLKLTLFLTLSFRTTSAVISSIYLTKTEKERKGNVHNLVHADYRIK